MRERLLILQHAEAALAPPPAFDKILDVLRQAESAINDAALTGQDREPGR
jgi:hypothetical protein